MDDDQELESEGRDGIPAISMEQLLAGSSSVSSLRCFIARRRLEPLLEEEDSPGSGKQQVGWWWQRLKSDSGIQVLQTIDSSGKSNTAAATERELNFAKLSREDVEFKKKILDLHRKLSHVDDGRANSGSPSKNNDHPNYERMEAISTTLKANSVTKSNPEDDFREDASQDSTPKLTVGVSDQQTCDKSRASFMGNSINSAKLENPTSARVDPHSNSDKREPGPSEMSLLNHSMIRRRSMKLLSFLSGKSSDRSQEERAAKLLKMYMPVEKETKQNTISIHHTSRDRRFWKLRNRRRSSSA